MNVFEELVEELKVENLLEQTVDQRPDAYRKAAVAADSQPGSELSNVGLVAETETDGRENYRKRAVAEVAGLQMVEHVLTGIERQYMMIEPHVFNDLQVKQALHTFLKVPDDASGASVQLEADGLLICETECWSQALAARDADISVANVRRFCENSRPVLSSQALIALARFYTALPRSEAVRAKFDFVMTRLFSRDNGDEKRRLLFGILDMVGHIRDLYLDWAGASGDCPESIQPGAAEMLVAFRQAIEEAETAGGFDELIRSDFFNRTRHIKESAGEAFFVPEVTAAAIECNVRIGNRLIDLLQAEKANFSVEALEEKYGYSFDSLVSVAASKTLLLAEILRQQEEAETAAEAEPAHAARPEGEAAPVRLEKKRDSPPSRIKSIFAVNGWLLAACIGVLLICAGGYFWSEGYSEAQTPARVANDVGLENSGLSEHIRLARSSSETFYGVVLPTWETMDKRQQKDLVQKTKTFAQSKGLKHVNLMNEKGRTVAYASGERLDLLPQ